MKGLYTCDENKMLGILGAILGGFIGYVLWVICSYYWLIPGIVGFVIAFLTIKGYMLFARSISRIGLIICIATSLLWISVSEIGSVMLHIYFEWQIHEVKRIFGYIPSYVGAHDLRMKMIGNTLFGIATFLVGCFNLYFKIWKETKDGPKERVTINDEDPEIFNLTKENHNE